MTPRFPELFWRQVLRPALRRPGLLALNACGIALGVAVFLAIQIANRGALSSFRASVDLVAGRAHLEARGDIDESLLPRIASVQGVRAASPLVEGIAPLVRPAGEYLRIVGIDPIEAEGLFPFRLAGIGGGDLDLERWLREPGTIAVFPEQARRMEAWANGGGVEVSIGGGTIRLKPAFEMRSEDVAGAGEPRMAAMDIGWAQELFGMQGRLTGILILVDDEREAGRVAKALEAVLPPGVEVAPPARRNDEMRALLGAFQLNLTAMSLVSVVVGMFLVYNSVSAAVVRRQHQIAMLRACGATRGEVRALFLGEAAAEAALGSALGVLAAPRLAAVLSVPVGETISSLYGLVRIEQFALTPGQVLAGFAVGTGAALLAAWRPAAEAAGIEPAKILHPGAPNAVFAPSLAATALASATALALAGASGAWALDGGPKWLGFVSAGFTIAAFALAVPWFTRLAAWVGRRCGLTGRLAADHLAASLHRNWATIAALAAAVSMSVAVAVMIHSFRASVARWVEQTLTADVYVAPATNELAGLEEFLPVEAEDWARGQPGVSRVAAFREIPSRWRGARVPVAALSGAARGRFEFLPGSHPDAERRFSTGEAAVVSESFASRFGEVPAEIRLPAGRGVLELPVAGVVRDFTRDSGTVFVERSALGNLLDDARSHSLAVFLDGGMDAGRFAEAFRERFAGEGLFAIYDNATLRERIFAIFEKTFAVTSVLRAVAIVVAAVGVVFSMTILAGERAREIGVLRAVGASRRQVLGIFLGEAALIGLASAISGLAGGAVLAAVLTWVVNKAFFGWTIELAYPLEALVWTLPALVGIAALAALLPAWRAALTPPAAAVRFE